MSHIESHLENLKPHWPSVVTVAIESRGFLEDEGIHREYESAVESMKKESETALKQVQGEAKKRSSKHVISQDRLKIKHDQLRSVFLSRKHKSNFEKLSKG